MLYLITSTAFLIGAVYFSICFLAELSGTLDRMLGMGISAQNPHSGMSSSLGYLQIFIGLVMQLVLVISAVRYYV